MSSTLKHSLINASLTALYVGKVGVFMFYAPQIFTSENTALLPIAMLLLFVFSAALTGLLIFGRPVLWYLEGKKNEALTLLFYTLGILLGITLLAFLALLFYSATR